MPPTNEIRSLTGLRGLAALYVVAFHYFFWNQPFSDAPTALMAHGYLSVDLFFVLSGFVMALNYGKMFAPGWSKVAHLRFLGRRIARIYPLYLASTVVAFVLVGAGTLHYPPATPLGAALILNALMVQTWGFVQSLDQPGWSISAEWAAYLLFPVLLVPTMFRKPAVGWLTAAGCAAALAVLSALPASVVHGQHAPDALLDLHRPWLAFPVLRCLPEFMLGILSYRLAATPAGAALGSSRWVAPALCLVILALLTMPRTDLAVVLLFPLLTTALASGTHLPGRLLASSSANMAGKLSYSIYLTHQLLAGTLNWIWLHTDDAVSRIMGQQNYATLILTATVLLTFPVAFCAYKVIELPGRRGLRALFETRSLKPLVNPIPGPIPDAGAPA
jgi:peptidoglycan/LPS O-acetylase OafA/YrhL